MVIYGRYNNWYSFVQSVVCSMIFLPGVLATDECTIEIALLHNQYTTCISFVLLWSNKPCSVFDPQQSNQSIFLTRQLTYLQVAVLHLIIYEILVIHNTRLPGKLWLIMAHAPHFSGSPAYQLHPSCSASISNVYNQSLLQNFLINQVCYSNLD